jgi:two-component system OmpR family sensor kinase
MGRLFRKCFLATWLTLILAGAVTFFGVRAYRLAEGPEPHPMPGPRAGFELDMAASLLKHAGPNALARVLNDTASPMLVIGPDGSDIRGLIPDAPLAVVVGDNAKASPHHGVLRVETGAGVHTLFIPGRTQRPLPGDDAHPPPPPPPSPWEPLVFAVLASALLSALLAWYLARPVKGLHTAFAAMAEGRLDTRVEGLMPRGDEFADLGRAFDRMAEKLQALVLAQRRLLHDVSHELRSPLGRLQAALGIARRDPARADSALERMEREVERLNGLIGEILSLARVSSGVEGESSERVDVGELVEGIAHDASFEAGEKGCRVRLEELARVHVLGRPRLLARAVENVVRNGLRYSPPGSELTVQTGFRGGFAIIRICDQGPGIADDEIHSVFEPFARGRNSGGAEGFGLGLAIARGAVELHGGAIEAANLQAGGLCVEIRLPAAL